ncbi:hypothetical protein GLOTRDRAFT_127846 [Gloeophyllum trabeum ATCC 11539]|uniref:Flavin reductase like domain-containing protein n=1 Tax=Gloeophyllum trabeum (strain ATCC 11539 / FP-39264 / Madison 617) TaxID=670483 RepID=S7QDX8_GLOTA|nr:uncharacterized protein GLOTRDRAFT_127846 [Gloeophyllum trabeum ATCC 11539]EPQ57493.1 hypothetical protein GLOTRDRAFT_127846 [Gloeophyllum trabeum ATCC 11539]
MSSRPPFDATASFKYTESPNPAWKLGDGLQATNPQAEQWKKDEQKGWKTWDMDKTPSRDRYKLLTSAIGPRPIAFVSSLSADGVPNLAPFSYFSMVADNPPLISIAFTLPQVKPKDTRDNIKATKEFTVNIISEPWIEAANVCSVDAPPEIDEWILSGLTRVPSDIVKPPRVKESAVSLECELFHFQDICPPGSDLVTNSFILGLIKRVHIRNAVLAEGGNTVDPEKLRPVARFGGQTYARLGDGFELSRPAWKDIADAVEGLTSQVNGKA